MFEMLEMRQNLDDSTNQCRPLHKNFAISEFQDLDLIPPHWVCNSNNRTDDRHRHRRGP
jgi:hypothetical protein